MSSSITTSSAQTPNGSVTPTLSPVILTNRGKGSKFLDMIQPFVIGGLSGMYATCIIQPIDMIKVSIQLKSEEQVSHKSKINPFSVAK